jgi:hypothetical protein
MKILAISMFVPFVFSMGTIQAGQTVEASRYPWLTPFIFGKATVTADLPDSVSAKWKTRLIIGYGKSPEIAQKLYPRIDSAALAQGWIKTCTVQYGSPKTLIAKVTYWKDWRGEHNITGPHNITFYLSNVGGIIVDWEKTPTDSAIMFIVQKAHDTTTNGTLSATKIEHYLSTLPQNHGLYQKLISEMEHFVLRDKNPGVRGHAQEMLLSWNSGPQKQIALSILDKSCSDPNLNLRFHAALFIIELGDTTNARACAIINNLASGKALDSLSRQFPGQEIKMKEIWYKEVRKAAERCK